MRVLFFGTGDFAFPFVKSLFATQDLIGVVTQPDRQSGRGMKKVYSALKQWVLENGLQLYQPESIKDDLFRETMQSLAPDLIIVASYGKLLPPWLLSLPRFGCINVHASLLPGLRGAAPIQRALLNGCKKTGVAIMLMDSGMDTGDIILQEEVCISEDMTAGELSEVLIAKGLDLLTQVLGALELSLQERIAQNHSLATSAPMIKKADEEIHWDKSGQEIHNQIRALNPQPGAFTYYNDRLIKIWKSIMPNSEIEQATRNNRMPGTILNPSHPQGILILCGSDAIVVQELQPMGKNKMNARQFVQGYRIKEGSVFGRSQN